MPVTKLSAYITAVLAFAHQCNAFWSTPQALSVISFAQLKYLCTIISLQSIWNALEVETSFFEWLTRRICGL